MRHKELPRCSHSSHISASCAFSPVSENLAKGALLYPSVAYLGLEDVILLPKVVHDSKDAQWPSEAQQVSQDAESAAEDQAPPEGMAEGLPDGPGTLCALHVLPLSRETHGQVRVAEGPLTAGPSFPGSSWLLLPGETQWHLLQKGELQEDITEPPSVWLCGSTWGPNMVQMGKLRPDDGSRSHSWSGPTW